MVEEYVGNVLVPEIIVRHNVECPLIDVAEAAFALFNHAFTLAYNQHTRFGISVDLNADFGRASELAVIWLDFHAKRAFSLISGRCEHLTPFFIA